MNTIQLCGSVGVILLIIAVGYFSGRNVKNTADFISAGGTAGGGAVAGMVMGALVGAACTVGSAQLGFEYGISGWWYTISCGIACACFGLIFAKPFRRAKVDTISELLTEEYGQAVNISVSLFSVAGLSLGLAAQLVSTTAIIPFIFPRLNSMGSLVLSAVLMLAYVVFGGSMSAGKVGKVKVILLCSAIVVGVLVICRSGVIPAIRAESDPATRFNMFYPSGAGRELGQALSAVLAPICTQIYFQSMRSARSPRAARNGGLISALLIPIIGAGSVLIGLFMRAQHPDLANSKDAFTSFLLHYTPDWLSGIFIGALLIAIVGGGASVSFCMSTVLVQSIIRPLCPRLRDEKLALTLLRVCIVAYLVLGCILSCGPMGSLVLNFTFLSARIVGASAFAPLMCALFLPGKIHRLWACIASVAGPAAVFLFTGWTVLPFDTMYAGILVSALCCAAGAAVNHKKPQTAAR